MVTIKRIKKPIGVTLDPDIVAYLDDLKMKTHTDRSWVINEIVREHRRLQQEKGQASPFNPIEKIIKV